MSGKTSGDRLLFDGLNACGCHNEFGFYKEKHFKEMLSRERKRTERSGVPFVLILIDVGDLLESSNQNFSGVLAVRKVIEALGEITRDTDIRGWYQDARVLGIIFIEIGNLDETTLLTKVRKLIQEVIGGWAQGQVELSAYTFPARESNSNPEVLLTFYPQGSKRRLHKVKRAIDITGSSLGILLFSPLLLTLSLLVKLTSRGPVFFRQKRVGEGGRFLLC